MVKPSKLYQQLVSSPRQIIAFRDFEALLAAFGFEQKRSRGSHRAWKHPQIPDLLTVQPHGKDARPYQVRKLLAMIEEFRLEMDA